MTIEIKRGDTFSFILEYREDGALVDVTDAVVSCSLRSKDGSTVQSIATSLGTETGVILCEKSYADTTLWKAGSYTLNIRVTKGGARQTADPIPVTVVEPWQ